MFETWRKKNKNFFRNGRSIDFSFLVVETKPPKLRVDRSILIKWWNFCGVGNGQKPLEVEILNTCSIDGIQKPIPSTVFRENYRVFMGSERQISD